MAPVNVLLSGLPCSPSTLCLPVGDEYIPLRASRIADAVVAATGLPRASFFLRSHAGLLHNDEFVTSSGQHTAFVSLCLRRALPGGKGGFGAMLRGAAASKKTTNFDACRDLQGRRLRHVRDEIAVREFLQRQGDPGPSHPQQENQSPRKRARPSNDTDSNLHADDIDPEEVEQDLERIGRHIESAVTDAVAEAVSRRKRPRIVPAPSESASTASAAVRPCDWMMDYEDLSSSESEATSDDATHANLVAPSAQGNLPLPVASSSTVSSHR